MQGLECYANETSELSWDFFEKENSDFFFESLHFSTRKEDTPLKVDEKVKTLLLNLGLSEKYPGKITLHDVLSLSEEVYKKPKKEKDLAMCILRKIIESNVSFREKILAEFVKEDAKSKASSHKDSSQLHQSKRPIPSGILEMISSCHFEEEGIDQNNFHPSDIFLVIFQCCNMHLQRIVARKVALCQYALPFIFQKPGGEVYHISLWPLRDIGIGGFNQTLPTLDMKRVSFIGLGNKKPISKSKLINAFLREGNECHATFFHEDCALGQNKRIISDGVVEISWYVPNIKEDSKEKNVFSDNVISENLTVLNLRGDGQTYAKITSFLCKITDVLVFIIGLDSLNDSVYDHTLKMAHNSKKPILIITEFSSDHKTTENAFLTYHQEKGIDENIRILSLYDMKRKRKLNDNELKEHLTEQVGMSLKLIRDIVSLQDTLQYFTEGFIKDEDDGICEFGLTQAKTLMKELKDSDKRTDVLKLQDGPWYEWSQKQKDYYRIGSKDTYESSETLAEEMRILREKQVDSCRSSGQFLVKFVRTLFSFSNDMDAVLFFLTWLRQLLNERSLRILPELHKKFEDSFVRFQTDRTKENKEMMESAEKHLADSSFELGHCIREVGQIFEAFKSMTDIKNYPKEKTYIIIQRLPKIIAKLLLLGEPFECMDGDVANVPLPWVLAVGNELKKDVGKGRLFAVTVLGIQSSGKSTLLNSMFGLQFPVSAGRCTRGVFLQLLPVKSLSVDYILVIDTEGLRAPELASKELRHDNELATFVIGLGDLVIVNNKGESNTEIKEILEIVVHGFIRLKQANRELDLAQSCIMVHQNVGAIDAGNQMLHGNKTTMQHLDEMAKHVARQEKEYQIQKFDDVIRFDPSKSIYFVPDLWSGSPPMAPVNFHYSLKVTQIAEFILSHLKRKRGHSVVETFTHLKNLWKGILTQDFVFSFRNTLDVLAYSELETEVQKCIWSLKKEQSEFLIYNARQRFCKCANDDDFNECLLGLVNELKMKMNTTSTELKDDLQKFIQNSDLKEQMESWKANKMIRIDEANTDAVEIFKRKAKQTMNLCKLDLKSRTFLIKKEKQINDRALQSAEAFKGKDLPQQLLEEEFENMWGEWIKEIADELSFGQETAKLSLKLMTSLINALYKAFPSYGHLIQKGLHKSGLDSGMKCEKLVGSLVILEEHVIMQSGTTEQLCVPTDTETWKRPADNLINNLFHDADHHLASLIEQDHECTDEEFSIILGRVCQKLDKHNEYNKEFSFKPEALTYIGLHLARHCFKVFKQHNDHFYEGYSVEFRLRGYKPTAYKLFLNTVEAKANEITTAFLFCSSLKEIVLKCVMERTVEDLNLLVYEKFRERKYNLLKLLLRDLADSDKFEEYEKYLKDPESYACKYFKQTIEKDVFQEDSEGGTNKYIKWTGSCLLKLITDIERAFDRITGSPSLQSITDWLETFSIQMEEQKIAIPMHSFAHVKDRSISDSDSLRLYLKRELKETVTELEQVFRETTPDTVNWNGHSYKDFFSSVWGCKELCPWCKEPCERCVHKGNNEKHRCIQHRPDGLAGVSWIQSGELVAETCNFLVQSRATKRCGAWCKCPLPFCGVWHECRRYKDYMDEWDIETDVDLTASVYWAWFMNTYKDNLAKLFRKQCTKLPKEWSKYTKENAKRSLDSTPVEICET
ncbi:hypothetical protein FSP39_005555 [Pinctada imbricata]|uniref:VLIG-type G domain-containing protein n=1 Tax=Pinctada imbricata TaxID=66713 RepID=A0AA89BIU9_PINIB|nr:hypothetical protein FSP39_005555 [Pinctada imbricata]